MKNRTIKYHFLLAAGVAVAAVVGVPAVRADEVSDWNQNMFTAVFTAKTIPLVTTRVTAMVQSAVFDAINGVHRRYTPVYVPLRRMRRPARRLGLRWCKLLTAL